MTEPILRTNNEQQQWWRWNPFVLTIAAFASYLMIALIRTYRGMDLLQKEDNINPHNHLRSHLLTNNFDSLSNLQDTDLDSPHVWDKSLAIREVTHKFDPIMWDERLFSPLMESFFPELRDMQSEMLMEPTFRLVEGDGLVKLTTSIPDVPLKDIEIEVVGGRIIHIRGMKTTDSSHVQFDKRFSIGQIVDEEKLEAKLSKEGVLEVSAPEVTIDDKDAVRKIPVTLAEEL